ncbi:hypothetical protein POPTR_014G045150v4 [Populus trichocarpa]|uniref:Uncharacterized protein n=1 Tax=Populus trichocarpa TaxID=3694 RepID=A0ACC0RY30_POPTR|nr:hypothetical protein POPTR_014G045150v4 [Populus trichocarpa]
MMSRKCEGLPCLKARDKDISFLASYFIRAGSWKEAFSFNVFCFAHGRNC